MSNEVLIKDGDKANWTPADSAGAMKQAAAVPDGSDLNTLLASLHAAGIVATE